MAAIFKLYSRSWFFLRWHRLIYALPVFFFLIDTISFRLRLYNSSILNLVVTILTYSLGIVLELLVIITVFKYKNVFDVNISTWELIRKYFWKTFGINIASIFWTLVFISPFCFFVLLVIAGELNGLLSLFLIVAFLAFFILSFAIHDLGLRILISKDRKIQESMWLGFKELSAHQRYYLPFVIASILLSALPFLLVTILSGAPIGFDSSLAELEQGIAVAERSEWSILTVFNYIIIPLNIAAKTLVYLDRNFTPATDLPQVEGLETL